MQSRRRKFTANGNHRKSSLSAVFGLLAFVSACTVGPNYSRPAITTPPGYKEAVAGKPSLSIDDVVKAKWWEIFGDADLNALEEQVDITNQNIAQAEARFRQARAFVQTARAA